MDLSRAKHFKVCRTESAVLHEGDILRIGQNGKSAEGVRLTTGSLRQVKGFTSAGGILLDTGTTLPGNYGHWSYGYVLTSHASQGKTCDHVIICQHSGFGSAEQFYVSVSRGRKRVSIFTNDKNLLRSVTEVSEPMLSATELRRLREGGKEEHKREPACEQSLRPIHETSRRIH